MLLIFCSCNCICAPNDVCFVMFCVAVRLCSERLRLVEKCIHNKPMGYRSLQRLLQLAGKLRVCGNDERQREGQVLVLIAEAALEVLWNIFSLPVSSERPPWNRILHEKSVDILLLKMFSTSCISGKLSTTFIPLNFLTQMNLSQALLGALAYTLTGSVCSSEMPIDFHWTTWYYKTHKIELITVNLCSSLNMKGEVSHLF
jgi:hypothetical protein